MDSRKDIQKIVNRYNVDILAKENIALKIGEQGAWLELRERRENEQLKKKANRKDVVYGSTSKVDAEGGMMENYSTEGDAGLGGQENDQEKISIDNE